MGFETGKICNTGGRKSNQDYAGFLELDQAACWVVADGLGGHIGGEVASETAVKKILHAFEERPECNAEALERYLKIAQHELLRLQEENPRLSRMRTTIVVVLSDSDRFLWGHVGDARFYHLRSGRIIFQTKDHSVPQAMVNAGDISFDRIRRHEDRNRLIRSMGQPESFRPEIHKEMEPLVDGDVFLLCTDGFWEYVLEEEMEVDFAKVRTPHEWLRKMESRVLNRAEGEFDNYTAMAVYCTVPHRKKIEHEKKPSGPHVSKTKSKPGKPSNRSWLIVVVILLAFAAGGLFMKWVLPKITDVIKEHAEKQTQKKIPKSPIESGPGKVNKKTTGQTYLSLERVWDNTVENGEVRLPRGYYFMGFKGNEKKLTLKGGGIDKTFLFIKLQVFGENREIENFYVRILHFLKQGLNGMNELDTFIESCKEIRIILIDDALKIINCIPEVDGNRKKSLQSILDGFRDFSIFELIGTIITGK